MMSNHRHSARAAVMLFFAACFIAFPTMSFGHAFPDHAYPKVGSQVSIVPGAVRIWFDGDLEPLFSTIHVRDENGKTVDKGDGRVDPSDATLLEVSVPALQPGTYRVQWDVVARDGHRTSGTYTFEIITCCH